MMKFALLQPLVYDVFTQEAFVRHWQANSESVLSAKAKAEAFC